MKDILLRKSDELNGATRNYLEDRKCGYNKANNPAFQYVYPIPDHDQYRQALPYNAITSRSYQADHGQENEGVSI